MRPDSIHYRRTPAAVVALLRAFPSTFAVISSRDGRFEVGIFEVGHD